MKSIPRWHHGDFTGMRCSSGQAVFTFYSSFGSDDTAKLDHTISILVLYFNNLDVNRNPYVNMYISVGTLHTSGDKLTNSVLLSGVVLLLSVTPESVSGEDMSPSDPTGVR
jgi:hypothetical protein